ncbi:MAG: serine hydrolase [Catalinimonas sp.]
MKRPLFVLLLLGGLAACSEPAPTANEAADLTPQLEALAESFDGDVGIYARHLGTGETAAVWADTLFPTASMIKVPIAAALFDRVARGEINYHETLAYDDSLLYPGHDLLGSFRNGAEVDLSKVVMLMLTMSDNTASLWCQQLAGGGEAINTWLEAKGFERTRVNSRTSGREEARRRYGWGQTTPREMAELLVMIREGEAVNPTADERLYRNLTRTYWDGEAISQLPPAVQVASKQGAVDASRSEVLLVHAPGGDYVFCVITKQQADTSWGDDNAGFVLLRDVSRVLWNYFEPDNEWQPKADAWVAGEE